MDESSTIVKYLKYIMVLLVVILIVGVLNLVQQYMGVTSPTGNANLPPRAGWMVCDSGWCRGAVYCDPDTEVCGCDFTFPFWFDICRDKPPEPTPPPTTTDTSIVGDIETFATESPGYITDTLKITYTDFDTRPDE